MTVFFQVSCALLGHQGAFWFVKASKWLIREQKDAVNPSNNIICIFIKYKVPLNDL